MGVLFVAALALIFYILLLRAQHLASLEDRRQDPEPQVRIEYVAAGPPIVVFQPAASDQNGPHRLTYAAPVT